MSTLIDKLGIKPIEQFECIGRNGIRKNAVCETSEVRELEQQRNELLEDEIENIKLFNHLLSFPVLKSIVGPTTIDMIEGRLYSTVQTIEKVAKKSWEEIQV